MPRTLAVLTMLSLVGAIPASAQRVDGLQRGLTPAAEWSTPMSPWSASSDSIRHSHWVTGAVIGGVAGLALGAVVTAIGEGSSDVPGRSHTVTLLIATAVGVVIGAMIGSGNHSP